MSNHFTTKYTKPSLRFTTINEPMELQIDTKYLAKVTGNDTLLLSKEQKETIVNNYNQFVEKYIENVVSNYSI